MNPEEKKRPPWLCGASFLLESGLERAEAIAYEFLQPGYVHRAIRWTGGCGLMKAEDWIGLRKLCDGFVLAGEYALGHHLLGGTRMRGYWTPDQIIPGITEVPVWVRDQLETGMRLYGITPRIQEPLVNDRFGTIVSVDEDKEHPYGGYFTTLRGDVDVLLYYQASANHEAKYDDERKRAIDIVDRLVSRDWPALLVSYNGGGVTKREILHWCDRLAHSPTWQARARVLLIKDSGRVSSELASDEAFLANNPWVIVSSSEPEEIAHCLRERPQPA